MKSEKHKENDEGASSMFDAARLAAESVSSVNSMPEEYRTTNDDDNGDSTLLSFQEEAWSSEDDDGDEHHLYSNVGSGSGSRSINGRHRTGSRWMDVETAPSQLTLGHSPKMKGTGKCSFDFMRYLQHQT